MDVLETKLSQFAEKGSEQFKANAQPKSLGAGCRTRFQHIKPESATCPDCKQGFESTTTGWLLCPECQGKKCLKWFDHVCPASYAKTNLDRLPSAQWETVSLWKPDGEGLLLTGESRTGKTRSAWMLIKRLSKEGLKVLPFSPVGFATELVDAQINGSGRKFIERVCKSPLVFFDDLGKCKLTDNVEANLFEVVEQRTAWERPTIVTTNDTGESLKARMTENRGVPLIERIQEFFQVVEF